MPMIGRRYGRKEPDESPSPLRLPLVRVARARVPQPRLRLLSPVRPPRLGGPEDAPRDKRPARRHGHARLRVRAPRDAAPPGWGVPVPGLQTGGPSRLTAAIRQEPRALAPISRAAAKDLLGGSHLEQCTDGKSIRAPRVRGCSFCEMCASRPHFGPPGRQHERRPDERPRVGKREVEHGSGARHHGATGRFSHRRRPGC
jgi:hypothetical protein